MKIYTIHKSSRLTNQRLQVKKPKIKVKHNKNKVINSFGKIFDKIDENPFLFQIIGISILTVAILISFQSLADFSTTPVRALDTNYEVRMLTSFQNTPDQLLTSSSKVEEIEITPQKNEPSVMETPKTYTVKSGDSLYSISQETKISIDDLINFNGLADGSKLVVGQELSLIKI